MRARTASKLLAAGVLLALAMLSIACQGGVGVGLGYSYPGRIHEMGGGGNWGSGPVWP
jgi:hypothetical protein